MVCPLCEEKKSCACPPNELPYGVCEECGYEGYGCSVLQQHVMPEPSIWFSLLFIVGFCLKPVGRGESPIDLKNFCENSSGFIGEPLTFSILVILYGKVRHVTLCFTGEEYLNDKFDTFAKVVKDFIEFGLPKKIFTVKLHLLGNGMWSFAVGFNKKFFEFAQKKYQENGVMEGKLSTATFHTPLPYFIEGGFKFEDNDIKQAANKEEKNVESIFYRYLKKLQDDWEKTPEYLKVLGTYQDKDNDKKREEDTQKCVLKYVECLK